MEKLWGGRFREALNPEIARFNTSFPFDRRLLPADIRTNAAYCRALQRAGLLSEEEAARIVEALARILEQVEQDPGALDRYAAEDVHSFVEARLAELVGESAYKLRTGRSRNDQVSTDLRLYLREQCDLWLAELLELETAVLDLAERYAGVSLPGYTHLQRAQPILWGHYLLAYFEMFERDRERVSTARTRLNVLPLGAGALAGTSVPIDREWLARELGFERVAANSLDAVSDRDFVLDVLFAAAVLQMHLSRLAEDFILYATSEFGFLTLGDAVSTGSSLMPQKKNPDALELIRGKAGRVFGHLMSVLVMMKGLPLAYNKDMQEDKEAVFDALDTVRACVRVATTVLHHVELRPERMTHAALGDYTNATELADYLVRKGLTFRHAHDLVGRIVLYAAHMEKSLSELSLEEYRQFAPQIEADVYEALSLERALASKRTFGGTAPERVRAALQEARQRMNALRRDRETITSG
ncbi:MAG: argininosuccinate lyase [Blastocatellia bacterium]|nr:argininosuccinate lyase [Blastocatellia bacterium]MCS7157208.1 argininosuccinate lyase [Blastocatellia bacterium]MCX7752329.1 argininosuccinate lyase [Blastocatellia bacterium]MDW8167210.1 argininosuccinate lyase [Acidobacteriota bacterium]